MVNGFSFYDRIPYLLEVIFLISFKLRFFTLLSNARVRLVQCKALFTSDEIESLSPKFPWLFSLKLFCQRIQFMVKWVTDIIIQNILELNTWLNFELCEQGLTKTNTVDDVNIT